MNTVVDDLSGTTLDGRYMLQSRLGHGAMGQVYIAHQQALDRQVAVKVLHPWLASEEKHRKRFLREARAATRIKHPNVVEMLDFGTTPSDSVYLVMELLQGRDLKTLLREEGPLPWSRARHFLLQAVAALREAHRQDVIHRDIKPANCFVCDAPEPGVPERMKLLDFGICKLEDPASSDSGVVKPLTQTGELVGTLAYMAPEFADGQPASPHTDMYALGIMAYQLLTGDVPFRGRNEFQVLARHLNEPPVRPRVLVPELPEAAELVVLTMLAKKPELRFESMADVEQAVLAIPGDGSDPVVIPRRRGESGSAPRVRPREGSAPHRRRRESSAPSRGRARQPTPSSALLSEPAPPPPRGRVQDSDATLPARAPNKEPVDGQPISDVWELGEPIDFNAPIEDELPKREWGNVATVVLLVLLLAAGIASVVIRQQGIEIWPWADEPERKAEPQAPIIIEPHVDPALLEPQTAPASGSAGATAGSGTVNPAGPTP